MAYYNTFVMYNCKGRKNLLVTSSARKVKKMLGLGIKVEVWNNNTLIEKIYYNSRRKLDKYVSEEKEYIAAKQAKAESRNKMKKVRKN